MRRVSTLLLSLVGLLLSIPLQAQWTEITGLPNSVIPNASDYTLYDVDFTMDRTTGYTIGTVEDNMGNIVGSIILKTTDGGLTWDTVYDRPENALGGHHLAFSHPDTVFALIGKDWSRGNYNIIRSYDGGVSWTDITANLPAGNNYRKFHDIIITPNGWIHILARDTPGYDIVSKDNGATWTEQTDQALLNGQVEAMHYVNDTLSFYGRNGGNILRNDSAGEDSAYDRIYKNGAIDYRAIYAFEDNVSPGSLTILAGGDVSGQSNKLGKFSIVNGYVFNGANNWRTVDLDVNGNRLVKCRDFAHLTNSKLLMCGEKNVSSDPNTTILVSEDAGASWAPMATPSNVDIWAFDFVGANFGFAVGSNSTIFQFSGFAVEPLNLPSPFCSGKSFDLAYEMTSDFTVGNGNVFTVVLSDSLGNFNTSDTVHVGTYASTALVDTAVNLTLPGNVSAGSYKIRMEGSNVSPKDTSLAADLQVGLDQPMITFVNNSAQQTTKLCSPTDSLNISVVNTFDDYQWTGTYTVSGPNATSLKIGLGDSVRVQVFEQTCPSVLTPWIVAELADPIQATTSSSATSSCGASDGTASVSYSDSSSMVSYQWGSNAGNQTGDMATGLSAGTYTCTVTVMETGCSQDFTVSVSDGGAPSVDFDSGVPTTYCSNGASVTLTASPSGGTFSGPGVTGSSFDPSTAGTGMHDLVYQVSSPCTAFDTLTVTVNAAPMVSLTYSGDSIVADEGFSSYTWYKDGVMQSSVTDSVYEFPAPGFYQLVVSDGTCESDTAEVTVTDLEERAMESFWRVYPNPAKGEVQVEVDLSADAQYELRIVDLSGRLVRQAARLNGQSMERIDVSGLDAGMYMLRLQGPEGQSMKRLMVE